MRKVIFEDNNHHSVEYKAERKENIKPVVVEDYTNDEGEVMLILGNGNHVLQDKYDALWNPPKGKCYQRLVEVMG